MSQSDYDDLICFEELNRADQDEVVVVVYECADAFRGRDPNTETEDINTKRILQTGRITLMYFIAHIHLDIDYVTALPFDSWHRDPHPYLHGLCAYTSTLTRPTSAYTPVLHIRHPTLTLSH
ncbi:hypothetical protein MHYP_G00364200 [Metynnis hypsauchen]